jgi:gluconate 2-dehydrogenase gamma chain
MSARSIRRRRFLAGAPAAIAGASALACGRSGSGWRFFTPDEARLVAAICDHIIPPDGDPGASWAEVPIFIDRQLMRFHKPHQKAWREGLAGVEQISREQYGRRFIELDSAGQLAVLQGVERTPASRPFFDLMVSHTMQGFYGPPRHGGNREAVSWRMLGLPVPPVRGRQI